MHKGVITTRQEFAEYQWPGIDQVKVDALDQIASLLPGGMKIMIIIGKLFTGNWLMQGMGNFFLNAVEDPEFVELLYDKICSLQWEVFERVIDHKAVGGIWNPDDFSGQAGHHAGTGSLPQVLLSDLQENGTGVSPTRQADDSA